MGEWSQDWFSGDGGGTLDDLGAQQSTSDPYAADNGGDALENASQQSYDYGGSVGPDVGSSMLPGVNPFGSGVGFIPDSVLSNSLQLGGKYGLNYQGDNLGTSPAVDLNTGGGSIMPVPGRGLGMVLRAVSSRLGYRVTVAVIVAMLRKFGAALTSQATGLNANQLLALWSRGRGRQARRRGVTGRQIQNAVRVARTLRSLNAQFQHGLGRGGGHRRRSSTHRHRFQRKKR